MKAVARYDDQGDALYDHRGKMHFHHDSGAGDRPEIDRTQLRDILLESLDAGVVRWGAKVNRIEKLPDGKHRVHGERAPLGDFDLVVGADGAWSKVRPLVSSVMPKYTGVMFVELTADDVDRSRPQTAALVPKGKISAVGGGQGIIAQRSSHAHVRTYLMFRVPEAWAKSLDLASPAKARAQLKAELPEWAPMFHALIDECTDAIVPRPIYSLPAGHRWEHLRGVTLLGDAAHVMPPFSGEGVNMAMLDATELALALASNDDWEAAIRTYEDAMFVRAEEAAKGAIEGLDFVSEDALEHVLAHFREIAS